MECDGCTLCCKLLPVPWMDSQANEYCKECDIGVGCKIFKKADENCRIFECCWKQMENANITLRPDKCGVVFEKISDEVIIGLMDIELTNLMLNQIGYFKKEGISVLMVNQAEKVRTFYLADGHTIPFVKEKIKNKWLIQHIHMT